MARPRENSPSLDGTVANKRVKTNADSQDPTSNFESADLVDPTSIHKLHTTYVNNQPFKYAIVPKLFQDQLLKNVKDEILGELHFSQKETDIYKINQTGDLASLSFLSTEQISLLPNLLKLRDALYSPYFRSFLRAVTGCGPLSGMVQDMSVASYTKGCHLLNHDDVIGTRRVSYILYMPLPYYQAWPGEWGGALELYDHRDGPDGPEPLPTPAKSIPPTWNQFIFFEVQPGKSFHSVEEIVVGGEGEDGRQRLSISGWFHAPQDGEEGYEPEPPLREVKSSREQLTATSTVLKPYPEIAETPIPGTFLSEEHIAFLSEFMNPVYLRAQTITSLSSRFAEQSSLELHHFLSSTLASKLEAGLREIDDRDGLGRSRNGCIPPHEAGTTSGAWTIKGPPHKWRYCTLTPISGSGPIAVIRPHAAQAPVDILRSLQDELFPSAAYRAWLTAVATLVPIRHSAEARRFRPGLDYTLATSEPEARLDVALGLTPSPESAGPQNNGWQSGEWGGWECYMAPHDGEDDPAVYHSGSRKKSPAKRSYGSGNRATFPDSTSMEDEEGTDSEDEGEEDDGMLLVAHAGFNCLLLVLRDEGVMRFVKYVSAAAEGSRWDICGEYEIGVVEMVEDVDEA